MINKALGGILLLVGTSIGAGMLALPIALAQVGFIYSIVIAFICWLAMYLGASYLLEVNLEFEPGSHLITMARAKLGRVGALVTWVSCLCLLYALLSGYIAGGSDVLHTMVRGMGGHWAAWSYPVLFTLVFGSVVYAGIRFVDYTNRLLMFAKLGIFLLVVGTLFPHIELPQLKTGQWQAIPGSLMILITSFGFASIVPSLRYYFQDDVVLLKRVILIGSFIPLLCYVLWIATIMGVLPTQGPFELMAIRQNPQPLTALIQGLQSQIGAGWIERSFTLFTIVCLLTAFLGVALGLFDFLADGLQLKKRGWPGLLLFIMTFIPPMLIVIFNPGIYLHALNYAGRCCVILLLIMPCLMFLSHLKNQPQGFKLSSKSWIFSRWSILGVLIFSALIWVF